MLIFFSYITQPCIWYEKVLSFSRIPLQVINTQRFIPAALIKMMFSINMEIEAVWSEVTHVPACFLIAHELILFMRKRKCITTTLALTRPVLFQPYTDRFISPIKPDSLSCHDLQTDIKGNKQCQTQTQRKNKNNHTSKNKHNTFWLLQHFLKKIPAFARRVLKFYVKRLIVRNTDTVNFMVFIDSLRSHFFIL